MTDVDLELKKEELALKRAELSAKIESERRSTWFTSPIFVAVATALFGLLGTAVGAVFQGYFNNRLERFKFESSLILKALETEDRTEAARRLQFLSNAGLITVVSESRIEALAHSPDQLPLLRPSVMPMSEIKAHLTRLGLYHKPIDDSVDPDLAKAVAAFQQRQGVMADGVVGPMTGTLLREAAQNQK
jgi:hypothetical protein